MAVTSGPRLGLTRWSAGTDSFSRLQLDGDMSDLDAKTYIFLEGTLAARPAAGTKGRRYTVVGDATAENNGKQFYDNGSSWIANYYSQNALIESSAVGNVAATIRGIASQTADLLQVKNSGGTNLLRTTADGATTSQATPGSGAGFYLGGPSASHLAAGVFNAPASDKPSLISRGAASQTADIFQVKNSADANLFRILPSGNAVFSADVSAATATISGTLSVGSITNTGGSVTLKNIVATPNAASDTPVIARGAASQTGNLFGAQSSGSTNLMRVASDGSITTSGKVKIGNGAGADTGVYDGTIPSLLVSGQGLNASTPALRIVGGSASTGNLFEIKTSTDQSRYWINNAGNSGQVGNSASASAYIGDQGGTPTQIQGTSYTPRLEVQTGTGTETFDDLVVLRHANTSTNAVSRRVGIAFKLGDEASSGNSNLFASVGVRSSSASSANPSMYFNVGAGVDTANLTSDGIFSASSLTLPATLGEKVRMYGGGSYGMGVQSATQYFRSGGQFMWYRGGVHDDTAIPGSGGSQLMNLDSTARLQTGKLWLTQYSPFDAEIQPFQIGNPGGQNLTMNWNTINSWTDTDRTTKSSLQLNGAGTGGELILGNSSTKVRLDSRTLWVGGNRVYWGTENGLWQAQGGNPVANDWWFDTSLNQIKVRNALNQWKIVADDATFG